MGAGFVYDNYLLPFIHTNKVHLDYYYNILNNALNVPSSISNSVSNNVNQFIPQSTFPTATNDPKNNTSFQNNQSPTYDSLPQSFISQDTINLIGTSLSAIGKFGQLLTNSQQQIQNTPSNMQSRSLDSSLSQPQDSYQHPSNETLSQPKQGSLPPIYINHV
ncbi:hypothetical protein AYI68_g7908 [Smittium mucronatum]|uniref:Uncharacterized protein n=1 Tax=Smittium mucronatum TaxID=133383 RepID=A0A1R0GMF4_9FUNG|nr:hypothetical protein AYI68_g7908 [Smittium mucronatum]